MYSGSYYRFFTDGHMGWFTSFFLLCKLNNSVSLCFYQIIFGNRILKSRFIISKSKCMYISLYYFYYEISNVYGWKNFTVKTLCPPPGCYLMVAFIYCPFIHPSIYQPILFLMHFKEIGRHLYTSFKHFSILLLNISVHISVTRVKYLYRDFLSWYKIYIQCNEQIE